DITERKQAELDLRLEQEKSERLLLNILPQSIADRLKQNPSNNRISGAAIAEHYDEVTILFADIVGFTQLSSHLPPMELVNLLNSIFSTFDQLAEQLGLEKIKTIGDAYMVAAGLPNPRSDHAEAIADMALEMTAAMQRFEQDLQFDLKLRIGINSGIVVAGVIGQKKFIYDLWGDAVNIASRMESLGEPGGIQVTQATRDRLAPLYDLRDRGAIAVKGKGTMQTYWLMGRKAIAPATV
ncbi:MAG: adenylate/guanylate cyclase domain-containing protein, partial [Elainellaceae cyanobacterium]